MLEFLYPEYSATILKNFEEEFNTLTSKHFDLICGTSTGGLIALAISLGIPCSEICTFYREHGNKIFPDRSPAFRWLQWLEVNFLGGKYFFGQTLWKGKYSNEPLKSVLIDMFADKTIGESLNLVCRYT